MKNPIEIKQAHPACANIIALFEHLHSNCKQPETATANTLTWLGITAFNSYANSINTALVFSDAPQTGKSFLVNHVIAPLFGLYVSFGASDQLTPYPDYTSLDSDRIDYTNDKLRIIDEFSQTAENTVKMINLIEKGQEIFKYRNYHPNFLLLTNANFVAAPIDRYFLVARCRQKLPEKLRDDVLQEIKQGGLFAFAELLEQAQYLPANFKSEPRAY